MAETIGQSMSFAEVLEEEYRYFFDDVKHEKIEFSRKHVREIEDLARRLDARAAEPGTSKWHVFAGYLPKTTAVALSDEARVLGALEKMLESEDLLEKLLADGRVTKDLNDEVWRGLLRIPGARVLLLRAKPLAARIAADRPLIPSFASSSAAIRVLLKHPQDRFRRALELYPALLSSIADDPTLAEAIVADPQRRKRLIDYFVPKEDTGWWARVRGWFVKPKTAPLPDRTAAARTSAGVAAIADPQLVLPPPDPEQARERLARFNAVVIETIFRDYVSDGHYMRSLYGFAHDKDLAALCLSGGGIRSATFNLGVLQGLADHRMLNRFHYLSTVSGGGYIGGWLSSWMRRHREGAVGVAKDLSRAPADPMAPEVKPIGHLRAYSSYLAPHSSPFSVDTWTIVSMYVRNLLLNWTILLPALAAALAVPRLMEAIVANQLAHPQWNLALWRWLTMAFASAAILGVALVRPQTENTATQAYVPKSLRETRKVGVWLAPLLLCGLAFCVYWITGELQIHPRRFTLGVAAASAASAGIYAFRRSRVASTNIQRALSEILSAAASGYASSWLLLYAMNHLFPVAGLTQKFWLEVYIAAALPVFLTAFFIQASLMVGLTTIWSSDHDREWWARSAAVMSLCGVLHLAASFAVLILPVLIAQIPEYVASLGGVSGITSWILGKRMGKAKQNGEKSSGKSAMLILNIAATITLLFVIALVALATTALLNNTLHPATIAMTGLEPLAQLHLSVLRGVGFANILIFIAIAAAVATVAAVFINVNLYSMHGMYRNRLIRAYLGASRWSRHPDAFTGFDPQDNVRMWELRPEVLWPASFLDFTVFVQELAANPHVAAQLSADRLAALVKAAPGTDRERLKAELIDELNILMLRTDIEQAAGCEPSPELLRANRAYLESQFPTIKKLDERVHLPADRLHVKEPDAAERKPSEAKQEPVRGRPPLHIVNATLNLVAGDNLAWQERKAASFTISPLHCGSRTAAYRDSLLYGDDGRFGKGITLGSAVTISGAAVSPNMGAQSSPIFTFLMTLFNARLGWWLGNPKDESTFHNSSPTNSLLALIDEALGKTDAAGQYVYLSDGGFFENLGIYEMVARRCKYIIVCDASADGKYGFGDLGNAVRKIRIDLGIPIELQTKYVAPSAGEKHGKYCAVGKILYPDVDGVRKGKTYDDSCGRLIYVKPAVFETSPPDVRNYRTEHESFPHDTTADQFFSESQFESYRALGRHTIGSICDDKVGEDAWRAPSAAAFFAQAETYVAGKPAGIGNRPITQMSDLVDWMTDGI